MHDDENKQLFLVIFNDLKNPPYEFRPYKKKIPPYEFRHLNSNFPRQINPVGITARERK